MKMDSNTESLNLLPSSFNFDLNLSKETLQFVNQFAESRFNSLPYDATGTTTSENQSGIVVASQPPAPAQIGVYSNETNNMNGNIIINSSFENGRNNSSDFENASANTSANTNKSNNPLLSCSTFNNESEDETNWESLL